MKLIIDVLRSEISQITCRRPAAGKIHNYRESLQAAKKGKKVKQQNLKQQKFK